MPNVFRSQCFCSILLLTSLRLAGQSFDILGTWAEPSADGVAIVIDAGKSPLSPVQLVIQRYNEYGDTVGEESKRSITIAPSTSVHVPLNTDDLKGAASIRYFFSVTQAPAGTITSVPTRVDLTTIKLIDQTRKEYAEYKFKSEHDLASARDAATAALKAKDKDISALRDRLAELSKKQTTKFLPRNIVLDSAPDVTPTSVGLAIRLEKPGPIQVRALSDSDARAEITKVTSDTPLTLHNVKIDKKLAPGTTYHFEISVLNYDGSPLADGAILTDDKEPRLRVSLPALVPPPRATFGTPTISDGKFSIKVTPDTNALLSVELFEQSGVELVSVKRQGTLAKKNPFGRPLNPDLEYTTKNMEKNFDFDGLKAEGIYQLVATTVDSLGQETAQKYNSPINIPKRTPDFDFSGNLELQISPIGFQAIWHATTPPKSGKFEVVFKDGGPITSQAAAVDGTKLTANLDSTALQQFYNAAKAKTQSKDGDNPMIKFTMSNGPVTKEAAVKISYAIPTGAQVEEAVKKGILTQDDQKKLTEVIKGTTDNNKQFKWKDFVSTGLGILLKFI